MKCEIYEMQEALNKIAECIGCLDHVDLDHVDRCGRQKALDLLAEYMDDDVREQVHGELAPCEPEEFLTRYLELDPEFAELLKSEFNLKLL